MTTCKILVDRKEVFSVDVVDSIPKVERCLDWKSGMYEHLSIMSTQQAMIIRLKETVHRDDYGNCSTTRLVLAHSDGATKEWIGDIEVNIC